MIIETATEQAVAITFPRSELGCAETLSPRQAREAVRNALLSSGYQPWAGMEIELVPAETEVLLIAKPASLQLRRFRFRCFEALAAALAFLPEDTDSDIVYIDGGFELLVREGAAALPNAVFEFGEELPCTAALCAHLTEHGDLVAADRAVAALRRYFC